MVYSVLIGEGNGTPLQYSCLENPMDRGAWWAAVHGVAKSRTWLSDFIFTFHVHELEKEMETHSCSCLENPRDGGAWWAAICGVTQSRTRLKRLSSSSSCSACSYIVTSAIYWQVNPPPYLLVSLPVISWFYCQHTQILTCGFHWMWIATICKLCRYHISSYVSLLEDPRHTQRCLCDL